MYVDLAGLARYKSDFDAWARGGLLPKDAAAARVRTAKAGAVSLVPVQQTPLDVSVDFLFTETPPASGDKGPDNPSTITGVSSVKATRCGKNVIDFPYAESSSFTRAGITYTTASDGSITANNTATDRSVFYILGQSRKKRYHVGDVITISGTPTNAPENCRLLFERSRLDGSYIGNYAITSNNFSYTFTAQDDGYYGLSIVINSGVAVSNVVFKPQIELGSTATSFELYEGADYTLPLGSTYYGGTLDVSTGVMTVTHYGYTFTGQETFTYRAFGTLGRWDCTSAAGGFHGTVDSTCTHYPFGTTTGCIGITGSGATMIYFVVASGAASPASFLAEQYAAGTPVIFVTKLPAAEQYTVTLTPTEILSLTQTDKYTPRLNTIYTDASAVQVGYLKHPSAASADLRNALVSLGGGV